MKRLYSGVSYFEQLSSGAARGAARGMGKLTLIVFGSIAAAAIFAGYHIIPFYYYYYEIQNQLEAAARVSDIESDKSIRNKLMYHIKKMKLPVEPSDLKIQRDGRKIVISLPYKEVFYITYKGKDYDIYTFHFHAYTEYHQ